MNVNAKDLEIGRDYLSWVMELEAARGDDAYDAVKAAADELTASGDAAVARFSCMCDTVAGGEGDAGPTIILKLLEASTRGERALNDVFNSMLCPVVFD